jgi:endonuclease YncB( thermonuclease family)
MAQMTVASLLQQRDALQRFRLWRSCAFVVVVFSTLSTALAWPGVVTHVSDGDTVWVQPLHGGEAHKVRLLGIDAPEICQPWGPQSSAALHAALQGQVVEVRARTRDTYGRLLAQLTRQGNDVGAWMVGQGYAWSYSYKSTARMRRCSCRRKRSTSGYFQMGGLCSRGGSGNALGRATHRAASVALQAHFVPFHATAIEHLQAACQA